MPSLTKQILSYAETLPEGTPLSAKGLLHLGNRAAVDQTLSRLVRRGEMLRFGRGVYVRPVKTKYGTRPPLPEKAVAQFAATHGETIVPSGAAAANALGLTTQVPVRSVYLTSGRSRHLTLGRQTVQLKHAKSWQLVHAHERVGQALRALEWLGPHGAGQGLAALRQKLEQHEFEEMQALRPVLPGWLAQTISASVAAHG